MREPLDPGQLTDGQAGLLANLFEQPGELRQERLAGHQQSRAADRARRGSGPLTGAAGVSRTTTELTTAGTAMPRRSRRVAMPSADRNRTIQMTSTIRTGTALRRPRGRRTG